MVKTEARPSPRTFPSQQSIHQAVWFILNKINYFVNRLYLDGPQNIPTDFLKSQSLPPTATGR
jgi:hypothetical protein